MEADKVGKWPAGTLTYSGLVIRESLFLVDTPYGVQVDGEVFVSPALYELLSKEEGEAFQHLVRSVKVLVLSGGLSDRVKGWDWTEEYGGLLNQNPMEEK